MLPFLVFLLIHIFEVYIEYSEERRLDVMEKIKKFFSEKVLRCSIISFLEGFVISFAVNLENNKVLDKAVFESILIASLASGICAMHNCFSKKRR